MKKWVRDIIVFSCCAGILSVDAANPAGSAAPETVLGPFRPAPALTVYVVADGEPVSARLVVRRRSARPGDTRVLARVFNPDEQLTFWQYMEPHDVAATTPGDIEVLGIPLLDPSVEPSSGDLLMDTDIDLSEAGVHQVRISAGGGNAQVSVALSRPLPYGVSFQNGRASPWDGQPETLYAFIPPRAEELRLSGGPALLRDEEGVERARLDSKNTTAHMEIERAETVWSLAFPQPDRWTLTAWGIPFILCDHPDTARAIRASVEVLPDGTVVAHRFQRRIAELLPELLAPERVGTAGDLVVPLAEREAEWLADPLRNRHLLGSYSALVAIEPALRNQNVEPGCHWGGATGSRRGGDPAGWHDRILLPAPENLWDRHRSIGLWAGVSLNTMDKEALAMAATLDAPFNPYFGKTELVYRAAAAALRDLMALGEDEVWRGVQADASSYPGFMAFALGQRTLPTYARIASQVPEEVHAVWTEGLRRIVDRSYPDGFVSTRNQSSHYLVAFQEFAEGSGQARYADLARAYARRFIRGLHPAGFAVEAMGPDATYNGMTHWHMAVYYRKSGDEAMGQALRRSYRFFNHTVAPEPDGRMVGASNFSHRTLRGFHREQWSGARGIADHLPEVGLWARRMETEEERMAAVESAEAAIRSALHRPPPPQNPSLSSARYEYYREPDRTGVWPAREETPFLRDLGGELVAVRRPSYYAAVYVGRPAPSRFYVRRGEAMRVVAPAEMEGGTEVIGAAPFLGGGLSLVATPGFGSAVLAKNWAPTAHHGPMATLADGTRYWSDYFATEYRIDEGEGTLSITGRIEGQPIRYLREYRFEPESIHVALHLVAEGDVGLEDLVENLPLALGPFKRRGVEITSDETEAGFVRAVRIRDRDGNGMDVVPDSPRAWRLHREGVQHDDIQIGRIQFVLPPVMKAGEETRIAYELRPVAP